MNSNIAVDIGGSNMRAASYLENQTEPIHINRITTRSEGMPIEDRLAHLIETIWPEDYPVKSIGAASPGPLDPLNGIVIEPPSIPEWKYFPLQEFLETQFSVPVAINNDANLAALGEWSFGAGSGYSHLIYLTVSDGVGGGIIIDNQLLTGASGLSSELGHLSIDPDGPACRCGKKGHLEAYASGPAIVNWVISRLEKKKFEELFPDGILTAKTLEEEALSGNQLAKAGYERAGKNLGIALADLLHIFNPEIVVIGGGVSKAGDLLLQPLQESVESNIISSAYLDHLEIVQASLGDNSGLLGALALAREISS